MRKSDPLLHQSMVLRGMTGTCRRWLKAVRLKFFQTWRIQIRREVNGQVVRSLFVSSIEPGEGLIAIPQARVDDCDVVGRYVAEGLGILQPLHFLRFRLVARDRVGVSQCGPDSRVVLIQLPRVLKGREGDDPADDWCASWSHDGRSIYFMSSRSGQRQIWKMPSAGGAPTQITRRGGHTALESADGRFLYYAIGGPEGELKGTGGLWRVPVNGVDEVQVLPSVTFYNFAIREDGLYFIPRGNSE